MAVEKQESEEPLSNFPTATTTTKYPQLWDTDSRGKSTVIEMGDDQGQYCLHTGEHRFEPNMPFAEYWKGAGGWKNAPHHHRGADIYYPEKVGSPWDQLALSCVLRDRHFEKSWRRILGKSS